MADALVAGAKTPPPAPEVAAASAPSASPAAATSGLFATANAAPGVSGIAPDFARIVETFHPKDAMATYEELEANLEVGEGRSDYATLRLHLDKAEARARSAHDLLISAKIEFARWEVRQKKVWSKMREKARSALEDEKARGEIRKALTNADVDERIAEYFPDEYGHQKVEAVKMKGLVDDIENLVSRWNAKASDLRTLLETLRK